MNVHVAWHSGYSNVFDILLLWSVQFFKSAVAAWILQMPKHTAHRPKPFAVVEFLGERGVEVVHESWVEIHSEKVSIFISFNFSVLWYQLIA